jgi:hypothetical protein
MMSSNLEEKLIESQEKMGSKLEEKLKESQENLKMSVNNSLKESLGKMEETMKCLEDRINEKIEEQKVELNVEIQEVEDRIIQRTMEETDWMKEYVDNSMTQRIEVIKSGISEVARQFDRRFQEADKGEARNNEKYKVLEEKISEICNNSSIVTSMEEKINELSDKIEVITKEKIEKEAVRDNSGNTKRNMYNNIKSSTSVIQESPIRLENFTYGEVSLPKFSNKPHENPMQYLKELENFFKLRMIPESSKVLMEKNS